MSALRKLLVIATFTLLVVSVAMADTAQESDDESYGENESEDAQCNAPIEWLFFDTLQSYQPQLSPFNTTGIYNIYNPFLPGLGFVYDPTRTPPGIPFNNAVATTSSNGLKLVSPLTTTRMGVLDHVKFLSFIQNPVAVPANGLLAVGGVISVSIETVSSPNFPYALPKPNSDYRLGTGGVVVGDILTATSTFMIFDTFFTNNAIYALYERLPFGWTSPGSYRSFTYIVPIATTSPGAKVPVHIVLDNVQHTISWHVAGKKRLTIGEVGKALDAASSPSAALPFFHKKITKDFGITAAQVPTLCLANDLGGVNPTAPVSITQLSFGPGVFTLLDFLPTPNLVTSTASPAFNQGLVFLEGGHLNRQGQPLAYLVPSPVNPGETGDQRLTGRRVTLTVSQLYAFTSTSQSLLAGDGSDGKLPKPAHGSVLATVQGGLTQAAFSCAAGYVLQGASAITCTAAGTWSAAVPSCVKA